MEWVIIEKVRKKIDEKRSKNNALKKLRKKSRSARGKKRKVGIDPNTFAFKQLFYPIHPSYFIFLFIFIILFFFINKP